MHIQVIAKATFWSNAHLNLCIPSAKLRNFTKVRPSADCCAFVRGLRTVRREAAIWTSVKWSILLALPRRVSIQKEYYRHTARFVGANDNRSEGACTNSDFFFGFSGYDAKASRTVVSYEEFIDVASICRWVKSSWQRRQHNTSR